MRYNINILVLNYNGRALLEQYLPSVVAAARNSVHRTSITVIDNNSSDGSIAFLKNNFSDVDIFAYKTNSFLCAYNYALKEISDEIVILLNNDIRVELGFVDLLVRHFSDEKVFFIAPKVLNMDGTFNGGRSFFKFDKGIIKVMVDYEKKDLFGHNQTIACGAFKRDIFLKLGGFDPVYLPGIWEESDLCYRALKQGYSGFYEPESIIFHQESTTFKKSFGKSGILKLAHRNMFIFLWKNLTDKGMFFKHVIFIVPRLIFSLFCLKFEFIQGFFCALLKMPQVIRSRAANIGECIVADNILIKA